LLRPRPAIDRVLDKVVAGPNNCIVYVGGLNPHGYGSVVVGSRADGSRRKAQVHRVVYEALVGPIPEGLELDHVCSRRNCVSPQHLEPVTRAENVRRSAERGRMGETNRSKTRCPAGHPYDDQNTYERPAGGRNCRECGRLGYHQRKPVDWQPKVRDTRPSIEAAAAARKARTHCKNGHEFTHENVRMVDGARICRACARGRVAEARLRKRGA